MSAPRETRRLAREWARCLSAATREPSLPSARPDELQGYLDRIADRWIARDMSRVNGPHCIERFERAKDTLANRGFMPVLEQTPDGYQLHEHNCPLMRLTADYPEVCNMIHRWLEALFGTQLNRVRCLRLGDPFSAYTITADSQAPGGARGLPQ